MTGKRIEDLGNVEVEHLLGLATGLPLVKLRAESDGTVLVGQLSPDDARKIANDLLVSAARAEYEHDFASTAKAHGFDDQTILAMLVMVREGEARRLGGA